MNSITVGFVEAFVIVLCTLGVKSTEAGRRSAETFPGNGLGLPAPENDKEMAKRIWTNCSQQLIEERGLLKGWGTYHRLGQTDGSKPVGFSGENIYNAIMSLSPEMKRSLMHCLRKEGATLHTFGEKPGSTNWLVKYLHFLFSLQETANPGSQGSGPVKQTTLAPAPALAPRQLVPAPQILLPGAANSTPHKKQDDDPKETAVAAAAIGGTLILTALFLLCYLRGGDKNARLKDDSPLLTLSTGDASAGSSTSIGLGSSSSYKQVGKAPSFVSHLSMVPGASEASSSIATTDFPQSVPFPSSPSSNSPGRSTPLPPMPPSPPAPLHGSKPPPPLPPKSKFSQPRPNNVGDSPGGQHGAPKAKLKPFFWDKVPANPDQTMVWHEISSGSFQFNEEMIESLFGYPAVDKNKFARRKQSPSIEPGIQYIQLIDSKKAQNLSILLRALNVTTEKVCDALQEGNELPAELLQPLLKMAPTTDEELKLRLYSGEFSQLGPAEQFLKELLDIPFSFKRLELLLFMSAFPEDVSNTRDSLATLEVACRELSNSRLFLKLLEAVLKTGNRMNDGTFRGGAQAFKLDTLLKLSDVKGTDGKTTLLHFVVQEIIRSEGRRAARAEREKQGSKLQDLSSDHGREPEEHYQNLGLQFVSGLSNELDDVKKASVIDSEGLRTTTSKLRNALIRATDFLNSEMGSTEERGEFQRRLAKFSEHADAEITSLVEEEQRIMSLVMSTANYFHGNAGKDEGLRLFVVVRDFLIMLDRTCRDVKNSKPTPTSLVKKATEAASPRSHTAQPRLEEVRQRLFPAIAERRIDNSSSSDDGSPSF